MLLRNLTFNLSSTLKKRLFSATRARSCGTKAEIFLSSKFPNNNSHFQILNSLHNISVNEILNPNEINQLLKLFKPVEDFKNSITFVIEETIANDIVEKILHQTERGNYIVVEANPGFGLITVKLINCGVKPIVIFENFGHNYLPLQQILLKYLKAVTYSNISMHYHRIKDFIFGIFNLSETNNSPVKFLGMFTNCYFLRYLVKDFLNNFILDERFEIYLVISHEVYEGLKVFTPKRFKYFQYCLLNLFFNIEELANYPSDGFLPVSKKGDGDMHLIKITRNSNFFKNLNDADLKEYIIFIDILGRKKCLIIQTLEKWLPNCGLYLISKGVSVTNSIQQFSPQECLYLFKEFQKCDGYDEFRNCIFKFFP